ncbi:MAG: Gfo/Idh/MocA family oxidoreductase [Actinomycetota bacterium]
MRTGIRVGLVGCGKWGRFVLRDLVALGSEVTVAVASEEGKTTAAQGGATNVVATVADLPEVDGIVVVTPSRTHAEVVESALEHGVPVFVEKPLTDDLAAADRLAERAHGRLFVMDKWRYHPGVELLGALARDGELGRVLGLRTSRIGWGNPHDVDAVWVLAPHDLSIGLEILGSMPAPSSAVADAADGYALGLVGLLGHDPWHALEVSTRSAERRREVTLICEEGVAVLPTSESDHIQIFRGVDVAARAPKPELRSISIELPLLRELDAFLVHLDGGPPPRSSAAEGAAVVRTIVELRTLAGLPA